MRFQQQRYIKLRCIMDIYSIEGKAAVKYDTWASVLKQISSRSVFFKHLPVQKKNKILKSQVQQPEEPGVGGVFDHMFEGNHSRF